MVTFDLNSLGQCNQIEPSTVVIQRTLIAYGRPVACGAQSQRSSVWPACLRSSLLLFD
jgi:hypothetical protein